VKKEEALEILVKQIKAYRYKLVGKERKFESNKNIFKYRNYITFAEALVKKSMTKQKSIPSNNNLQTKSFKKKDVNGTHSSHANQTFQSNNQVNTSVSKRRGTAQSKESELEDEDDSFDFSDSNRIKSIINEKIQKIKLRCKFPTNNFHTEVNQLIQRSKNKTRLVNYKKVVNITEFKPSEEGDIKLYKSKIPIRTYFSLFNSYNKSSSRNFHTSVARTEILEDPTCNTERPKKSTLLKLNEIERKFGILPMIIRKKLKIGNNTIE
jgi:hypothetical protein